MGPKITIDSATMMNKGLEVIEAHFLFGLPGDRIDAVIHPQSLIHSFVEFVDGSLVAQLAKNDMKFPIVYALSHPERLPNDFGRLDLVALSRLDFFDVDPRRTRPSSSRAGPRRRGRHAGRAERRQRGRRRRLPGGEDFLHRHRSHRFRDHGIHGPQGRPCKPGGGAGRRSRGARDGVPPRPSPAGRGHRPISLLSKELS
jgi:hypothetical protein